MMSSEPPTIDVDCPNCGWKARLTARLVPIPGGSAKALITSEHIEIHKCTAPAIRISAQLSISDATVIHSIAVEWYEV